MSLWELTATGHRCTVHRVEFKRGEVCTACANAKPQAIVVADSDKNEHDDVIEIDEAECREQVKTWSRRADDLWTGTPSERNTALKAGELSLKFRRAALDAREKRAGREHSLTLLRHEREMSGNRKGN